MNPHQKSKMYKKQLLVHTWQGTTTLGTWWILLKHSTARRMEAYTLHQQTNGDVSVRGIQPMVVVW